jgi:LPS-assembly protein
VLGSARYDVANDQFDQTRLGLGYVDDCLILSVNWLTGYTYPVASAPVRDNTVMFQFSLRTLGADALAPVSSAF